MVESGSDDRTRLTVSKDASSKRLIDLITQHELIIENIACMRPTFFGESWRDRNCC